MTYKFDLRRCWNIILWFIAKGAGACFPFHFLVVWQGCCSVYYEVLAQGESGFAATLRGVPTWCFIHFREQIMKLSQRWDVQTSVVWERKPEKGPSRGKDRYILLFILFLSALRKTAWLLLLLSTQYYHISFKFRVIFHISTGGGSSTATSLASVTALVGGEAFSCFGGLSTYSGHIGANPVSTSCLMGFFSMAWCNLTHEWLSVTLAAATEPISSSAASNFPRSIDRPRRRRRVKPEFTSLQQNSFSQVTQSFKLLIWEILLQTKITAVTEPNATRETRR